jgi:hypothetical protein
MRVLFVFAVFFCLLTNIKGKSLLGSHGEGSAGIHLLFVLMCGQCRVSVLVWLVGKGGQLWGSDHFNLNYEEFF